MDYTLTHNELIWFQTNRVLSVIKMATIKKGYVSTADIREHLNIPTEQLIEIRNNLLSEGIIEEYTP